MQMKAILLDSLGTCISTISQLVDYIQSAMESVALEDDETETIEVLQSQLSQLLHSVREISVEWQVHFDRIQINRYSEPTQISINYKQTYSRARNS